MAFHDLRGFTLPELEVTLGGSAVDVGSVDHDTDEDVIISLLTELPLLFL